MRVNGLAMQLHCGQAVRDPQLGVRSGCVFLRSSAQLRPAPRVLQSLSVLRFTQSQGAQTSAAVMPATSSSQGIRLTAPGPCSQVCVPLQAAAASLTKWTSPYHSSTVTWATTAPAAPAGKE